MDNNDKVAFPLQHMPDDLGTGKFFGLYPQRQEGVWLQRVKILGGVLSQNQWCGLGRLGESLAPEAPLHLTTRQDIELHDLTPDAAIAAQQGIAELNLTGLAAGGDSLRNITVCPCCGVRSGSVDLVPLAWEIRQTLEARAEIYTLPRKFKISFSCSPTCGQPWINDLGFVAVKKDGQWGFRLIGAGSLGANPETGIVLCDWLSPDEVCPMVIAAVKIFHSHGDRKNRRRARLRHLRQRLGDNAFVTLLRDKFEQLKVTGAFPKIALRETPDGFDTSCNLNFPGGDIIPDQARALGTLAGDDRFRVRIGNHHGVVVFARDKQELHKAIADLPSLSEVSVPRATIVACAGKRWCKRALVETNAIADKIRSRLGETLPAQTIVCISGCPNDCAHAAVADIGLIGQLVSRNGQKADVFKMLTGGAMGRSEKMASPVAEKFTPDEILAKIAGV